MGQRDSVGEVEARRRLPSRQRVAIDLFDWQLASNGCQSHGSALAGNLARPAAVRLAAHDLDLVTVVRHEDDLPNALDRLVVAELLAAVVVLGRGAQDFDEDLRVRDRVLLAILEIELDVSADDRDIRVGAEPCRSRSNTKIRTVGLAGLGAGGRGPGG